MCAVHFKDGFEKEIRLKYIVTKTSEMFVDHTSLPCAVVASMKEAQEKLTGDAFRTAHVGDEL